MKTLKLIFRLLTGFLVGYVSYPFTPISVLMLICFLLYTSFDIIVDIKSIK
jgi:hypothetical protein